MAADAPTAGTSFWDRLGALAARPRLLTRRDLLRRDGKAGDDLIVVGLVALLLEGAPTVLRMIGLVAAGRVNTALHRLHDLLAPGLPLIGLWLITTILFAIFTTRAARRAAGELGARVTEGYVLASLLVSPLTGLLGRGLPAYLLGWLPWACAASLFGLILRESLEEPGVEADAWVGSLRAAGPLGWILGGAIALLGMMQVHQAWQLVAAEGVSVVRNGAPAPAIVLPLLDGQTLRSASLGRPTVITFWATWCGPCLTELPVLERLYRARGADAPLLFAINLDEEGPDRQRLVRGVVARLGLTMPIALDDGRAAQAYSISSIPSIARLGADGRLVEMFDRPLGESELGDLLR